MMDTTINFRKSVIRCVGVMEEIKLNYRKSAKRCGTCAYHPSGKYRPLTAHCERDEKGNPLVEGVINYCCTNWKKKENANKSASKV